MSIKARFTALLLHIQQLRNDIYGCQVSGGQIEKVYYRSQPGTDIDFVVDRSAA